MASLWTELKRRNVVKVALAYAAGAWLLLQLTDVLVPLLRLPDWTGRMVLLLLLIGFPIALFSSWVYTLTPEGLKRESDTADAEPTPARSGRTLDFTVIAVLAIALAWFAVQLFQQPAPAVTTTPVATEQSVAVLPFVDMSPEQDQEYFSDGIAEELLNQLVRLRGLHVAGRTSSFSFKESSDDLRTIGEKLDVAHIIEGSVRKAGERVRITVQLIKVADGYHLWSQTYDRDLDDIFAIQEETARAVADALSVTLGVGDIDFEEGGTRNFEAYDARLQAQALILRQGPDNMAAAIRLLEKSVSLDPGYGDGWGTLANAYFWSANVWMSDRAVELHEKSRAAAERALEIAPGAVQTRLVNGLIGIRDRDWEAGEKQFREALERAPADLFINVNHAGLLLALGRLDAAIEHARQAVQLDPLSLTPAFVLAVALQSNGDSQAAWSVYEQAKGLFGNHVLLNGTIVVFALEQNDRAMIEKYLHMIENDPASPPVGKSFSRLMKNVLDDPEAARRELHRAYTDPMFANPLSRGVIAVYAAYFGDPELSLTILQEQAVNRTLPVDSIWRPIYSKMRRLPEFKDLVRELGLDDYWRNTGNWATLCRPDGPEDFTCE